MEKRITSLIYLVFFISTLVFTACQNESEDIGENVAQESIRADSNVASLIKNTSSNDGSFDNIVDGASCIAIRFPYSVEVNGVQVAVNAEEDFLAIERIFDETDIDKDSLNITFPITIIFPNYDEEVVESSERLRALAATCVEGGNDDDIECIDFIYPMTIFSFNTNNQQTGETSVTSDRELRIFFGGLNDNDIVGIDYPLTLKKFDATEIIINTTPELVDALETAKDECDEDDDNDYNDDDFTEEQFDGYLVQCEFKILEMFRDETGQIEQYVEYALNFTEGGRLTLTNKNGNTFIGAWSSNFTTQGALVDLELDEFVEFNLEWLVYEIAENTIKFSSANKNKIVLERHCPNDANAFERLN